MFTTTESRLWLAVHLLYPSASQAFDVYQAIVQQSENLINQNNKEAVFTKLVQAFEKIPAVSSNLSFYEFEFDQIDQWKIIYKNSQKIQLIIFVGVLIFEMKMADIAPVLKLTADKAQFLFHQIFKKLAQNSSKLKYNEQLNFKKQNDLKISYLYTYENLIEYCLGQLPPEEHEKVRAGLDLYPILQMTKDEYSKIISQIQNLKVQKSSSVTKEKSSGFSGDAAAGDKARPPRPFYRRKRSWALLGLISVVTAAVVFQMTGVLNYLLHRDQTLVIQSVEKKPETAPVYPEVAAGSVPQEAPVTETSDDLTAAGGEETAAATVPVSTDSSLPVAAVPAEPSVPETAAKPVKPGETAKPAESAKPATTAAAAHSEDRLPAEPGGLFRGTLAVQDVNAVNGRLAEKMAELGAVKAGEVALGWMKTDKVAYYHYIIPEKNIAAANAYLRGLGRLNVKFEKHPRALPPGSRRFIIEVGPKE